MSSCLEYQVRWILFQTDDERLGAEHRVQHCPTSRDLTPGLEASEASRTRVHLKRHSSTTCLHIEIHVHHNAGLIPC